MIQIRINLSCRIRIRILKTDQDAHLKKTSGSALIQCGSEILEKGEIFLKEDRKADRTRNIVETLVDKWIDFSQFFNFLILSSLFNCCLVATASNRMSTMLRPHAVNICPLAPCNVWRGVTKPFRDSVTRVFAFRKFE